MSSRQTLLQDDRRTGTLGRAKAAETEAQEPQGPSEAELLRLSTRERLAFLGQLSVMLESGIQIRDREAHVVQSLATAIEKARDNRVGLGRLQQLDARLPDRDERHAHLLRWDLFALAAAEAQALLPDREPFLDGTNRDTKVIDLQR